MKKIIVTLICLMTLVKLTNAQFGLEEYIGMAIEEVKPTPIRDVNQTSTTIWRSKDLAIAYDELKNSASIVSGVRNTASLLTEAKDYIQNLYDWQQELQADIRAIISIKDLKWADVLWVTERALGVELDLEYYMPKIDGNQPLKEYLEHPEKYTKTEIYRLYDMFGSTLEYYVELNAKKGQAFTVEEIDEVLGMMNKEDEEYFNNKMEIMEMDKLVYLQLSDIYKNIADELLKQAEDLGKQLNDGKYNMTQAEQLMLYRDIQEVNDQALTYKKLSSQYLFNSMERSEQEQMIVEETRTILEVRRRILHDELSEDEKRASDILKLIR